MFSNYNASVQKIDYCFGGAVKLRLSNSPLWPFEFANCQLEEDIRMGNKKPLKRNAQCQGGQHTMPVQLLNLEESFES